MINKISNYWYAFLISAGLLLGCDFALNTEVDSVSALPSLALPIGYGNLSIQDFLSKDDSAKIKIYKDGVNKDVVYIVYEQTLETRTIRDLLSLPNRNLTSGVSINPNNAVLVLPPNTQNQQLALTTVAYDFGFSPEKLNEILLKQGTIRISATTVPAIPGLQIEAIVKLPTFRRNNIPLQQTIQNESQGSVVPLQGYTALLVDNTFDAEVTVFAKSHNVPIAIPPGTKLDVSLDFQNLDFVHVRGFFGDQLAELPEETLKVGLFQEAFDKSNVSIAAPLISFVVINEYGAPVKVIFSAIEARNEKGKLPIQINPASPVDIIPAGTLGDSVKTTVMVTNAKQLIDFVPNEFYYKAQARINTGLTSGNNFCADTSELKVRMRVEVPFIGRASNIILRDTIDVDLEDAEESVIERAFIKISAQNNIPLDASLQLYLLGENFVLLDSLLNIKENIIVGAQTSIDGVPTAPGVSNKEISISKEKLNKLFQTKKIIIASRLQTSDNPKDVKFRASDKLNVKLGLNAKLKLKIEL